MKRILFIIGFISLLCQIVLLRELNTAYFGIELIYTTAISFWLIGTAAGALINKNNPDPTLRMLSFVILICTVLIPADIFFIRGIRVFSGEVPGAFLPFHKQILFLGFTLIPLSLLLGLAFQWGAKIFINLKHSLSLAYAIESAGGIAAGLLSTLLIASGISNFRIGILCCLTALFIYSSGKKYNHKSKIFILQCIFSVALLFLYLKADAIDLYTASWNNPNIIATADTPYTRVAVSNNNGQFSVFEDDALCYETESAYAEEFCILSLLSVEKPKRILLLGGGYRGFLNEVLKFKYLNIDYVEYNQKLIETLTPILPSTVIQSQVSERVRYFYSDPREFLNSSDKYDAIITGLPEPTSGQTNRYYTQEFFSLCAGRLTTNGILAFSLRSEENLWSPVLTKRNASIYKTLKSVFGNVEVLPGTMNIFIASPKIELFNNETLSNRFLESGIAAKLISPQYIKYLLNNDRYEKIKTLLNDETASINTDNNPISYQYTIAIWLSKFFPDMSSFSLPRPDIYQISISLVIVFAAAFFIRRTKQIKNYVLIFAISLIGMMIEMVLLIKYQTVEGILFQNIGLLLTSFMAGLTTGAFGINRFAPYLHRKKHFTFFVVFFFALFCGANAFTMGLESLNGLALISILIFIDGFFVSALFSILSLTSAKSQKHIVAPLYAADILGGSIGAFLTGLILIPLFGLTGVLLIAMAAAITALIIV